jgi:uncharacterized repeat protein (TIGR03803 family)
MLTSRRIPLYAIGFAVLIFASATFAFSQTEKVLYNFAAGSDGAIPSAGLVFDSHGNLYGTTSEGGNSGCSGFGAIGCGTVFKLAPGAGGGWTESVIHVFDETDGGNPSAVPVLDSAGNLYGTTLYYGTNSSGTVWELSPASDGTWSESTLHTFTSGWDGFSANGLRLDSHGNIYGSTFAGGTTNNGLVYKLLPGSNGTWSDTVLYDFTSGNDGNAPTGVLAFDPAGNIYGTTYEGGPHLTGMVFELAHANGAWAEKILYTFQGLPFGKGHDGTNPTSGVIFDKAGNIYGTTSYGGPAGVGTVFKLTRNADGSWSEVVLYSFTDGTDGGHPNSLLIDKSGNLYGTTSGHKTLGSVFKLAPSGGSWTFTVLHDFAGPDGSLPTGLIRNQAGHFFGTTAFGGATDNGVVFEITP